VEQNWISWFKKISVLSLSYWESDVYWCQNNKHFAEFAPQNGGKRLIWRNYVTVTLFGEATAQSRCQTLSSEVNWKQVVKVIWRKAASPHMDVSVVFAKFRQCVPHLIHVSLGPPESTPHDPNGISIGSAVLHSSCTLQWATPFHSKLPIPTGIWTPPNSLYGSLSPPEPATQTASRSVQPFSQGSRLC